MIIYSLNASLTLMTGYNSPGAVRYVLVVITKCWWASHSRIPAKGFSIGREMQKYSLRITDWWRTTFSQPYVVKGALHASIAPPGTIVS